MGKRERGLRNLRKKWVKLGNTCLFKGSLFNKFLPFKGAATRPNRALALGNLARNARVRERADPGETTTHLLSKRMYRGGGGGNRV